RRPYGGTYVRTGARGIVAIDHFRRRRAWLVLTSRSAREPLLHGEGGEARARGEAELLQHVLDVARDGVLADQERGRDALVRLPRGDEREHLRLARGEPAWRAGPGRFAVEPRQVGQRAEALEDPARGVGLHGGGLVIAERAAGDSDERARPRRLVGHLDLLPDCPRPAQRRECRARVPGGDEDAAFGAAGERAARRSHVGLLEGDADRLLRGVGLAARKPEERAAGLERPSEAARLAVRLLG